MTEQLASTARMARVSEDSAVVLYLVTLTALGSRIATLSRLKLCARYLDVPLSHLDPRRWSVVQIEALRTVLAAKYAPATANLALYAIRGVLRAALRLGHIDHAKHAQLSDFKRVPGGNVDPPGRHVDPDELSRLFGWYAQQRWKWARRDVAGIALLYGCGLRIAESCRVQLADRRGTKLTIRGKGNKQRLVTMPPGTVEAVEAWLDVRGREPGPVLAPCVREVVKARQLTPGALYSSITASAERAGLEHFSPHDLRRTVIGDLFDLGVDVSTVQRSMGHASPSTTTRYDRRPARAQEAAAARLVVPFKVAS